MDQTFTIQEMFADGFSMNAALRYLPYRFFPLALGQLDQIRENAAYYRARWLVAPVDVTVPIPAFGNLETTQRANNGSILYGFNFAAVDGNVSDFEINIREICNQESWFDQTVDATVIRPTPAAAAGTDLFPVLFEPRILWGDPHPQLNITIGNKASAAQRCQLLVMLAEPCVDQSPTPGPLAPFPWDQPVPTT